MSTFCLDNFSMRSFLVIAILALTFGTSFAEANKRVALVIGNDSYKSLPDLNNLSLIHI